MLKEVKVCGELYKVKLSDSHEHLNSYGSTRWSDGIIYIDKNLSEEKRKLVLLHEVLHCIAEVTDFANLPRDISCDDAEEGIIRRMEHVLFQVLKENKGLGISQ